MDKGIRVNVNAKFVELNALRIAGELSNKAFRRDVMLYAIDEFDISVASAATHYNHAFLLVKQSDPSSVTGLGRAEDKKGGRKPKAVAQTAPAVNDELTPDLGEAQTLFAVKKKKDDSVIAEGLTLEQARELCSKAAAQKKAALYWM